MQSSAVLTLRALVMLLCLVLVPLAAVFGTAIPNLVVSAFKKHALPRLGSVHSDPPLREQGGEAPAFAVEVPAGAAPSHPNQQPPFNAPQVGADPAPLWSATAPGGRPAPASGGTVDTRPAQVATADVERTPAPPTSTGVRGPKAAPSTAATAPPPGDRDSFHYTQQRLRDLGATYYLLETWGQGGQAYRFHCKMALSGNPTYSRKFEATDADPIQAMQRVLAQVEQWRSGRQP